MKRLRPTSLTPYVIHLERLPFVQGVRLDPAPEPRRGHPRWDALMRVRVADREHRLYIEHKTIARLNYALIDAILARHLQERDTRWILFTPRITPPMAAYLQERGVHYVDAAGNIYLVFDKHHVVLIDGRRPEQPLDEARAMGSVGNRVVFALLARPEILASPVREIAVEAGVGKTAVATTLKRLEVEGLVAHTRTKRILIQPDDLLHRWLAGYLDTLRPRLLIGRYRTPHGGPRELEARVDNALNRTRAEPGGERMKWAWGGAAAGLTEHYRGETTVLHIDDPAPDLVQRLHFVPDRTGPLTLLRSPGPVAYVGEKPPYRAHPLLVYAELLAAGDDRAREAAAEIHARYLKHPA